jgi:hypothetical protein
MQTDGRTERQTDRQSKTSSRFHNLAKAPKKDKNTFDGFNSYLHGLRDFVLYLPSNPLFGAFLILFPLHVYFIHLNCVSFHFFL